MKLSKEKQIETFNRHYGARPEVLAQIWEDILDIDFDAVDESLKLTKNDQSISGFRSFLRAHYWLWSRPRNIDDFASHFGEKQWKCEGKQLWNWISRISALTGKVIKWDERFDDDDTETFILTIDGVDFKAWEKKHPHLSKDPKMCSHKFVSCAYRYMIAVSVYRSKIAGIYGPYPGGKSEIDIFREHIKTQVKLGKLVVADKGNKAKECSSTDKAILSLPNPVDNQDFAKFKARALARHESVNGRIKYYKSMSNIWTHGMTKHGLAVRAVATTVQYKMDHGSELFPVFVEGLMNKANASASNIVSL